MTDFNVMEGGAPSEEERECQRDKEWAKMKSSGPPVIQPPTCFALSKGRKPHEILLQMKAVIDAAIKFQAVHDYWPNNDRSRLPLGR